MKKFSNSKVIICFVASIILISCNNEPDYHNPITDMPHGQADFGGVVIVNGKEVLNSYAAYTAGYVYRKMNNDTMPTLAAGLGFYELHGDEYTVVRSLGVNHMRLDDTVYFSEILPFTSSAYMNYQATLGDQGLCLWAADSVGWAYATRLSETSFKVSFEGRLIKKEYCKKYDGDPDTVWLSVDGVFSER